MAQTPLKVWHGIIEAGRAFMNEKGVDLALFYLPFGGPVAHYMLREAGVSPSWLGQGHTTLKVLHPRRYQNQGVESTAWTEVGRAFMHAQGIDLELHYAPCALEGQVRLILRPLDPPGQHRGPPQGQAQRAPQFGGAAAAPAAQGFRAPQHRDQLTPPNRGPEPPTYNDPDQSDIPF